jgi:hypothetical protein
MGIEDGFLDTMKGLTSAFAQGGYIIAGLFACGIGATLLANHLRWKSRGTEVEGTITGVKRHGKFFYPVYSYSLPDAGIMEAMSDEGTADHRGIETGATVKIIVMRDTPHVAHALGRPLWPALGAVLFLTGVCLLGYGFTAYEVNTLTWAITLAFVLYSAQRLRRIFGTKDYREVMSHWRQRQWEDVLDAPAQSMESIRSDPEEGKRLRFAGNMQGLIGAVFAVTGAISVAGALYMAAPQAQLALGGSRAEGKVVQLAGEYAGGGNGRYLYFPVVSFSDKSGHQFTFQDGAGDNPAAFDEGEAVTVVYLEDDPQESAALERGGAGWLAPGLLAVFGLVFLLGGMSMMPRQRDEVR